MLTILRPAEAAAAEWEEINFDKKIWTIPGSRMKNPKKAVRTDLGDHLVPLSTHGFRKLASRYLNERGFSSDHIEKSLAHKDKNAIRAIYNQAEYIEPRRVIMQAWADFIETSAKEKYANLQSSVYS